MKQTKIKSFLGCTFALKFQFRIKVFGRLHSKFQILTRKQGACDKQSSPPRMRNGKRHTTSVVCRDSLKTTDTKFLQGVTHQNIHKLL